MLNIVFEYLCAAHRVVHSIPEYVFSADQLNFPQKLTPLLKHVKPPIWAAWFLFSLITHVQLTQWGSPLRNFHTLLCGPVAHSSGFMCAKQCIFSITSAISWVFDPVSLFFLFHLVVCNWTCSYVYVNIKISPVITALYNCARLLCGITIQRP